MIICYFKESTTVLWVLLLGPSRPNCLDNARGKECEMYNLWDRLAGRYPVHKALGHTGGTNTVSLDCFRAWLVLNYVTRFNTLYETNVKTFINRTPLKKNI